VRQRTQFRYNTLGNGLVHPFRRVASSDFVSAEGEPLIRSCISQILGTRVGELRWRPAFGINLEQYRHRNTTDFSDAGGASGLSHLISSDISTTLSSWESRIGVVDVQASVEAASESSPLLRNKIVCQINWSVRSEDAMEGSDVLIGPVSQEVTL